MSSGHELILYALHPSPDFRATVEGLEFSGQHFTQVCGNATHPDGLPGSGQAHLPDVFVLSLRRDSPSEVVDGLAGLNWGHIEGVLLISGDYIDGPMEIHRLGYQPPPPVYC